MPSFTLAIYNAVFTKPTFTLRKKKQNTYKPLYSGETEYNYEDADITIIESIFIFILGIIDFFIYSALWIILLPYYFIEKTLEWILRLLPVNKDTPTKYSHLITKTAVLALATFIFLQYAHTKLADNPITNYFKNLFNKLGIQLDNNALTASLISMTIFAVLFMLRPPYQSRSSEKKPLDNHQFTFFMVLSIAAGPIAYTLNTSLAVVIVIGLAPLALALLMLVGNTISID